MMEEKVSASEMQFIQFISMFSNSAMQHLGKFTNPLTGKIEKNLAAAQATIDILAMLKEKTKGNLSKREDETLTNSLANPQLNYAEEVKRAESKKEDKKEEKKSEEKSPEAEGKKSS